jgi:methionyl aminopeptidase
MRTFKRRAKAGGTKPKRNPLVLNDEEREKMRAAGKANATLLDVVRGEIKPGVRTGDIDTLVETWTRDHGYVPATVGYGPPDNPFPKACCISVNEVVCHGVPGDYVLQDGDIANVDLTTIVDGWHGDQSETFLVGEVAPEARALVQCAFDALYAGIDAIKPGGKVYDIGLAIYRLASSRGYGVVRDYQGHGLGRRFHQDPGVPHFPDKRAGAFVVQPGMCFTIEPMINAGTWRTVLDRKDGWTVYTADRSLSAQFEHTLLMTEDGPEILTQTEHGPRPGFRFDA